MNKHHTPVERFEGDKLGVSKVTVTSQVTVTYGIPVSATSGQLVSDLKVMNNNSAQDKQQ